MGGEHLVELPPNRSRRVVPRIDRIALFGGDLGQVRSWAHDVRSQNAGPTGSMKSPLATR